MLLFSIGNNVARLACLALFLLSAPLSGLLAEENMAYARFVPERSDDLAFENDKVAFRVYGPALKEGVENNGIDCWLKRVDYPIIDKWYRQELEENKSYHQDWGEGYDPYKVGASLGAGSMAVWQNNNLVQPNVFRSYQIVENGPDRVVIELKYRYEKLNITEWKTITLERGSQLFQVSSKFTREGLPLQLDVAIGVTTHHGKAKTLVSPDHYFIAAWEKIDDSYVGTGVVLPKSIPAVFVDYADDASDEHALLVARTDPNGSIRYSAGFAWAKAGEITSLDAWKAYLEHYDSSSRAFGTSPAQ